MKKLSVVIVSYNECDYLREAIESCLSQDFDHSYEIIIGDDGSDDGSIDIIKEYKEKYPDILMSFVMDRSDIDNNTLIPSFRVSNLLKKAFSMCTGEYLCVLSGDDRFIDEKMWKRDVEFLDNNHRYVACYSSFKYFWSDGREEDFPKPIFDYRAFLAVGCYIHISCFVFRRKCLNYMLDRFCDDSGLRFSIARAGRIKYLPGTVFGYRQREKSIMHEADKIGLAMLEMLLYQDILNSGKFLIQSMGAYKDVMQTLMEYGNDAVIDKYNKYLDAAASRPNNVLSRFWGYKTDRMPGKLITRMWFLMACRVMIFMSWITRIKENRYKWK